MNVTKMLGCVVVLLAASAMSVPTLLADEWKVLYRGTAVYPWSHEGHSSMGGNWGTWALDQAHAEISRHIASMVNLEQLETFVNSQQSTKIDFQRMIGVTAQSVNVSAAQGKSREEWSRWVNRNNYLINVSNVQEIPGTSGTKTSQDWQGRRSWKAWMTVRYTYEIIGPATTSSGSATAFGNVFATSGAGTYYKQPGGSEWAKQDGNQAYRFQEVQRTGDYIELACISGGHNHVRLYLNHVRYRQLDERGNVVWRTFPDSVGQWR